MDNRKKKWLQLCEKTRTGSTVRPISEIHKVDVFRRKRTKFKHSSFASYQS